MPRNGTGQYVVPAAAGNPVQPLTPIQTTWANPTLADLAAAMTMSVSSDGQTTMTGALNLGNNKVINQAAGVIASDGVNFAQVFTSPAFTGVPTAPTAALGTATTQIATTAFVNNAFASIFNNTEPSLNQSSAFTSPQTFYLANQQILYSTGTATNDVVVNLTASATQTLATYQANNSALAGIIGITNGATAYKISQWQIDGISITPKFVNGLTITQGNAASLDVYGFSLLKDATGNYLLLVNLTTYS